MEIKEVPLLTVLHMRKEVMYPALGLHEVKLEDDEKGTHLGLFDGDTLCSVISLFLKDRTLQFRKFATRTHLQGKGYGTRLLQHVFVTARTNGVEKIWCNARMSATALYQKFGMQPFGEPWEERGHIFIKMQTPCCPEGGT